MLNNKIPDNVLDMIITNNNINDDEIKNQIIEIEKTS